MAIHQDDEDTENFYISVGDEKGFPLRLRDKSGKDKTLQFNSAVLSRGIMKAFRYDDDARSISFKIVEQPKEYKGIKYYLLGHLPKTK